MNKLLMVVIIFLLPISFMAQAEPLTADQRAIISQLQKMYAIDPYEFEAAIFGAKFKNAEEIVAGKYDPPRQCRLIGEFLVKEAIRQSDGKVNACDTGFRYPGMDGEDINPASRIYPIPKPLIHTPVIQGNQAKVYVTFLKSGGQNVFYYLKKLPEGWRIYRAESRGNEDWLSEIKEVRKQDHVDIFPPEKYYK